MKDQIWSLFDKKNVKRCSLYFKNGIVAYSYKPLTRTSQTLMPSDFMTGWDEDSVLSWCKSVGWRAEDY